MGRSGNLCLFSYECIIVAKGIRDRGEGRMLHCIECRDGIGTHEAWMNRELLCWLGRLQVVLGSGEGSQVGREGQKQSNLWGEAIESGS